MAPITANSGGKKKKKKSLDKGAHYLYDCDKLCVSVCDGM